MDLRALERICGSFRTKLRGLQLQSGIARLVILGLVMLPLFLVVDWWVHLPTIWRLIELIVYAAVLGTTLWFTLLKPLARSWSDKEVLRYIDAILPQGQGMLLDLYELLGGEGIQELTSTTGRDLAHAAVTDLTPIAQQVRLAMTFQMGRVRRWLAGGAVMALLFAIACVTVGDYVSIGCQRFFNPFSGAYWPHRTNIEIAVPKNGWSIPQMENFTLEASVTGLVPPQVTVAYKSESTGYWIKEKVDVKKNAIAYVFKEVRQPLKFYISGGDFDTNVQPITVVERPYLKTIAARYEFPKYAKIPDKEEQTGQLRGLEGTKVFLTFTSSIPITRALFILDQEQPEELKFTSDTTFTKELMLTKNGSYVIQLFDKSGFREPGNKPERYEIQVTPDEPPVLEVLAPGSDLTVTKNVMVDVSFKARDDFGLKKLEIQYQINEGELLPLSDRITGPITQTGLQSKAEFHWDLRRIENLPEQGTITCVVTAQDVNPTGRGVDKKQFQITLVKISEFHRKAIADAQEIMREALNAYNRQWDAWQKGQQLAGGGSGKLDDPLWKEMTDAQKGAEQSAKKMSSLLAELTLAYETNHLEREFMAGRLKQLAKLLKNVTGSSDAQLNKIADLLRTANPKGSSDEVPERLKALRGDGVNKIKDHQKTTVLYLEKIISKAYDWRDLQSATIDTTLLCEDQTDVKKDVEKIDPKWVTKEVQDLTDEQQTELAKIGTRQRGLFDSESKLETMLSEMIYAAQRQQRKNILPHLKAPFDLLRNNRTKDMLDEASRKIANNQAPSIKDQLKKALDILEAVKTGLLIAGEKIDDKDEAVALDTPLSAKKEFDVVKEVAVEKKPDTDDPQTGNVVAPNPQNLLNMLPPGQDKLSILIARVSEAARSLASRTTYLSKPRPPVEMPRCMKLNFARAKEIHGGVSEALKTAITESEGPAIPPFLKEELAASQEPVTQMDALMSGKDVSPLAQHLQDDFIRGLDDLVQFIAFQKKVDEATAENKKGKGVDDHQQKFLLREKDLEVTEGAIRELKSVSILQKKVLRTVTRFSSKPAQGALESGIEKTNRERAAATQTKVAGQMDSGITAKTAGLTAEVMPRVKEAGLGTLQAMKLGAFSAQVTSGSQDKELATALDDTSKAMDDSMQTLLDVLEERVKAPVEVAKVDDKVISKDDFEKQYSADALSERIKADASLPPEIKEKMLLALSKEFPAKYKELLKAYYSSCIQAEKKP